MHHVPRSVCCTALAWFCVTATGCFTPAHLGGIEDAHALAREFGFEQKPRPVFMFAVVRMTEWDKIESGRLVGECERDGVRYREYHFATALAGGSDRCLRVLVPMLPKALSTASPASDNRIETAPPVDAPPAIIEEFLGPPAPGDLALLQLSDGGIPFNDKSWAAHLANDPRAHSLALTGLDGTPSLSWKPIDDGGVWDYAVIDRIAVKKRGAPTPTAGPAANDAIAVAVGAGAWAAIYLALHPYIAGVALRP